MLQRLFRHVLTDVRGRPTTVAAEMRGAVATFLTMAYILPVNAGILKNAIGAEHVPALIATTALAAGICCILMGWFANFPVALASGMGLNALVAYQLTSIAGSWQAAMGMIVIEGLVILLLVLLGLREAVMRAIPRELRLAIGAGIGLFIALIGLEKAGISTPGFKNGPLLQAGNLREPATFVAAIGLVITAVLMARRITGALLLGILATTAIAFFLGVAHWPASGLHWPTFAGVAFQADILGALKWQLVPLMFAVLMVDFFDTLGTATAIAEEGDLMDPSGQIPGVRRLLIVDSLSASIGGLLGVSSNTCYIESASGVAEGARSGLHTIFVGVLFLLAIVASPLLAIIPKEATAPVLILVGFFMLRQIAEIHFDRLDESIPAFITLLTIFATFSIAHGIGFGVVTFVAIKVLTLRPQQVHPLMYVIAAAFVAYFALAPAG
jgi:AGZA family xanthine/uracil permease-like MFS transporter